MDAWQLDILRRLEEIRDHQDQQAQRLRAALLTLRALHQQATATPPALRVPPPLPEPSPAPPKEGAIARFIAAGGWPAAALLLSCLAPLLAGVLVWAAWATGTPLPTLILAIFGVAPDAHATP